MSKAIEDSVKLITKLFENKFYGYADDLQSTMFGHIDEPRKITPVEDSNVEPRISPIDDVKSVEPNPEDILQPSEGKTLLRHFGIVHDELKDDVGDEAARKLAGQSTHELFKNIARS